MKTHYCLSLVIAFLTCLGINAQDRLTTTVAVDTASKYVWRGLILRDFQVEQTTVSTSLKGFTLGYWNNVDMTDDNGNEHEITEHNYWLSYTHGFGSAGTVDFGAYYYYLPSCNSYLGTPGETGPDPDSMELKGGYAVSLGNVIDVSLRCAYDVDEVDSWYSTLGLSKGFKLDNEWTATLGTTASYAGKGYNSDYLGDKTADWNDLTFNATVSGPLTNGINIWFSMNYSEFLNGKVHDTLVEPDIFWMMMGLSYSF